MPQRQNVIRVETPEVMGEGSFVMLRSLEWGSNKELQKGLADANGGVLPRSEADISSITANFIEANDALTRKLICESVLKWNWVDDDGQELPLPQDGGIDKLSMREIAFLMQTLQNPPDPKASGGSSSPTSGRTQKRR